MSTTGERLIDRHEIAAMARITEKKLTYVIHLIREMDHKDKEVMCDEIFREQPNLLASVLVLTKMAVSPAHVEVVLKALMVAHLALRESGERIKTITDEEQEREFQRLAAWVKFAEGMAPALAAESIKQYVGFQKEPWLLAYVIALLQENGVLMSTNENSKYPVLSALNLVGCIANAQRIA
ncbi:uncharacterized protein sS8_2872 [Methylocaldum marinum]|uniref:Uncharacterized protein n=1 Tax=Methylocaldum marinum TaxID=1432792 RepID=A0A250KT76_9GAMM|nr:hypothetical protein [Methylocaldum marinum]BBA34817.1 uncharacterized protein sS8_2872 [Methylocaldum marinum]